MSINFRYANKHDTEQIVNLLSEGFGWNTDKDVSSVFFSTSQIKCIVAEEEKILGTATLYILEKINRRIGQIEDVVVSKEHRGKEIGLGLVKRLLNISETNQCYKTILNTHEQYMPFYAKLGFKREQCQMVIRH